MLVSSSVNSGMASGCDGGSTAAHAHRQAHNCCWGSAARPTACVCGRQSHGRRRHSGRGEGPAGPRRPGETRARQHATDLLGRRGRFEQRADIALDRRRHRQVWPKRHDRPVARGVHLPEALLRRARRVVHEDDAAAGLARLQCQGARAARDTRGSCCVKIDAQGQESRVSRLAATRARLGAA